MIIYKITNKVNGKVYVGQTRQDLLTRWRQHCTKKNNCRLLAKAIAKHGKENFEVIELVSTRNQEDLDFLEIEIIKKEDCISPKGYNLTSGGEGGYTRSDETRALLSEASKKASTGRKHTEETKAKLSKQRTGIGNPAFGKKQSQETKDKRSKALLGKKRPESVRQKIAAGHARRNLTKQPK